MDYAVKPVESKNESVKRKLQQLGRPRWRKFTIPALLLILLAIPLTVYVGQQVQEIRQRAAELNPAPLVTSVTASASPVTMTTSCPAVIKTTGYITTSGPATVTYQWTRSDGSTGAVQSITFSAAGTQAVSTTWTMGGNGNTYNNWQAIKILTPNAMESNHANFTLTCRASSVPQVTGLSASAAQNSVTASCPYTINHSGAITVNGPTAVTYQWIWSDGGTSPAQTVTYAAAGTYSVASTWQLGANGSSNFNPFKGWKSLKIISPNPADSSQATFSLTCQSPTVITSQVTCGTGALTPDQICQKQGYPKAATADTPIAKGYWWRQCGGAAITCSNSSSLSCTINTLDCTNKAGYWGSQNPMYVPPPPGTSQTVPYSLFYTVSGTNGTAFNPLQYENLNCTSYNPGYTMRVACQAKAPPSIKITSPASGTPYADGTIPLLTITAEAFHPAGISYVTFVGNNHGCVGGVTSTTSIFTCDGGFKYVESTPVSIVATMYPKDGSAPISSAPITITRTSLVTPTGGVPIQTPTGVSCAAVLTPARNTSTQVCATFPSSCLPTGWVRDSSCEGSPMYTPTPTPNTTGKCSTNTDCTGVTGKPYCVNATTATQGTCVECRANADCATGKVCSATNTCVVAPVTPTPTNTPTPMPPTLTPTPTRTPTPIPPTFTPTPTRTPTPIPPTLTWTPTPTSGQNCAQVLTPARNTSTQVCATFPNSCIPAGWVKDITCDGSPMYQTPTPTSNIAGASVNLTLYLEGIGAAGDLKQPRPEACKRTNGVLVNPSQCFSNQNPVRTQRDVNVQVLNGNDVVLKSVDGKVAYDAATGTFKGKVDLGTGLANGSYNIKVQVPTYLRNRIPGIPVITAGQTTNLLDVNLVATDVDLDNKLTILDYNQITKCYTFPGLPSPCNTTDRQLSDVNDDGKNDEFDQNLFLRELGVL